MEESEYVIQFSSVFKVPEIGTAFYKFLKTEYNTDDWDFILQVKKLQENAKTASQKKVIKQVLEIYSRFIAPNAKQAISVSETHKKKISEEIVLIVGKTVWSLTTSPSDFYDSIKKILIMEYKNDSFKRFSRDQACLALLEKYKGNRNVLLPQLSMVYNYNDEDFDATTFEKKDKEFLEKFVVDNPNWKLVCCNKTTKATAYKSTWNYFPNVSFLTATYINLKFHMIFNYSLQEVACAVFSKYQSSPTATNEVVIEFKNQQHVILQENSINGSSEFRVKRVICSLEYNAEKRQIKMKSKPTRIPDVPFLKKHLFQTAIKKGDKVQKTKGVQKFAYETTILTAVDENKTMVEHVMAIDIGGYGITDGMIDKRVNSLYTLYSGRLKQLGDKKTIKAFKYDFNDLWQGIPKEPIGKLLYDLNIDKQDEEFQKKIEKRNQVFNLSHFVFHYSALKRKEIENLYYDFLKKEFNTDSYDFLIQYNSLIKLKKVEETKKKLNEIINTFVLKSGTKYLGLESKEIEEIVSSKTKIKECIDKLRVVYHNQKMEHQLDSFQRFVKTPEARMVLPKYQHDIEVMSPILQFVTLYKSEDFQLGQIVDKDVTFALAFIDHSKTWDLIHTSENTTVSMSKVNWFRNCPFIRDSSIISLECTFEFNYPIEQVANGFLSLSSFTKVDPIVNKVKYGKFNEETNQFHKSVILNLEVVWGWKSVFTKEAVCSFVVNGNQLIFISKPISPKDGNWYKKSDVISYFQYKLVVLTKKDDETTIFQNIYCIDSDEKIEWDQKFIGRAFNFYPLLKSRISKSAASVEEMKEVYERTNINGELKDPLGNMLLSMDFRTLHESTITEDELSSKHESSSTLTEEDALSEVY